MNDESLRQLENELSSLTPAPIPSALHSSIAAELEDAPLTFADRILAGFMTCGALAATVIIAIVILTAATGTPSAPQQNNTDTAARQRLLQEYQSLLAQR